MSDTLKKENFVNNNEVRWCPGCGDYAILAALQKFLPSSGRPPEKHVFVSGIGCAGRLPYYVNAYGYHTIHGRALSVATGLKMMRDDLAVWVITGDGDALSIGGNHLLHCLRRNVNLNILLLNNEVYGLTKGQYSPTSKPGQVTKTSPEGLMQQVLNPLHLALASGASFVARAVDKDPNHLSSILKEAYEHQGTSFVEIYQDCNIFNNGAFDAFAQKNNRSQNTVILEHGRALRYGKEEDLLLDLSQDKALIKSYSEYQDRPHYIHDKHNKQKAIQLADLSFPDYPVPLGVYYQEQKPCFTKDLSITKTREDLAALLNNKASWQQA